MIHSWPPYPNGGGVFERAQLLAKRKSGDPNGGARAFGPAFMPA